MRRAKWWIIAVLLFVLASTVLGAIFSHGALWSLPQIVFQRLLKSLPPPPGWVPETNRVNTNAYSLLGFRYYDVKGEYGEIAEFFRAKVPQEGWQLLKEKEYPFIPQHDDYIQSMSLLFSRQDLYCHYCLQIDLGTAVDKQGIQKGDRVWVHMTISWEDYNCYLR